MWWWIGQRIGIGRHSIIVLDSVPECRPYGDRGFVGLCDRANNCAGAPRSAHRGAALVAFIPQNVFYSMNNDVLSPLCFGVLFLCVLQWFGTDAPSLSLGALSGLALAATCLTKLSNLAARLSRARSSRCEIHRDHFPNTACRSDRPSRADFVRHDSGRHLDTVDKISFWRCDRFDGEN